MYLELAIIVGLSIAGVISGVFIDKISCLRRNNKKHTGSLSLSKSARAEVLSLLFEKNLTAEAITRVYEAYQNGRIDRLERDRLLVKYKEQLDSLNQRVSYLQPIADFSELKELRENLVSFLEGRISALDKKLSELSKSRPYEDAADINAKRILDESLKVQSVQSTVPTAQNMFQPDETSIEQLQKEIIQALQHLEQIEIDKK
jgi:hypothetical protein